MREVVDTLAAARPAAPTCRGRAPCPTAQGDPAAPRGRRRPACGTRSGSRRGSRCARASSARWSGCGRGQTREPSPPPGEPTDLLDTPDAGPAAIRGGAIRVVGYGAGIVITALSAALLFRHLGVDDGGRYVTVLALVSIVAGLTDAGLTGIGMRELVVRHPSEREPLIRNLLGMRIVLGVVGLAGAVGVRRRSRATDRRW